MKKSLIAILIILSTILLMILVGCTNNKVEDSIAFSNPNVKLNLNEEMRLELTKDGLIILDGIEWSTSNNKLVSVKDGLIKAEGIGKVTISANYQNKVYKCDVEVVNDVISISETSLVLELNEEHELVIKMNGEKVNKGVTWRNSNNDILSLENGKLKALKLGDSVISAKYNNSAFICNVKVIEPFNAVGSFYNKYYVKEMDVTFEFDLILKEDGSYTYSRRANEMGNEALINQGAWKKSNGEIICSFENGEMRFKGNKDQLSSIGDIDTGGMVALELTFDRVK